MSKLHHFTRWLLVAAIALMAWPVMAQGTGIVTADVLNIRNQPIAGGGSEVIGQLSRGQSVSIVGRNADTSFFEIVAPSGVRGWASSAYIYAATPNSGRFAPVTSDQYAVTTIAARGIVNAHKLNVRTAPDVRAEIIAQLSGGNGVDIIGRNSNSTWFEVRLNDGRVGWANAQYLVERNGQGENAAPQYSDQRAAVPAAIGLVRASRLNVRIAPDPFALISRVATSGERVTLLQTNSDASWYRVRFEDGAEGWVYSTYITFYLGSVEEAESVTVPDSARPSTTYVNGLVNQPRLNVRAVPSPNGTILTDIGYMARLDIVGRNSSTTWLQVNAGGTVGWVYAPYITPNIGNFQNLPVTG